MDLYCTQCSLSKILHYLNVLNKLQCYKSITSCSILDMLTIWTPLYSKTFNSKAETAETASKVAPMSSHTMPTRTMPIHTHKSGFGLGFTEQDRLVQWFSTFFGPWPPCRAPYPPVASMSFDKQSKLPQRVQWQSPSRKRFLDILYVIWCDFMRVLVHFGS